MDTEINRLRELSGIPMQKYSISIEINNCEDYSGIYGYISKTYENNVEHNLTSHWWINASATNAREIAFALENYIMIELNIPKDDIHIIVAQLTTDYYKIRDIPHATE